MAMNELKKEHTLYALQSRYTSSTKYDTISISAVILKLMVKITSILAHAGP